MKLNNIIKIYVPSTVNVNEKTDNSKQIEKASLFLSSLFGGCTCVNALGNWIDSNNKLVAESVTICYAFCDRKAFRKSKKEIIKFCRGLCAEMSQECISLELNNKLYFIG